MDIPQTAVPLLDAPRGCKLRVEELIGSPSVRSRLYSMGILPGTEMELCRGGCGGGSVCVRVRQCSLVLGEGMAKAIFCRPADENEHHHRRHRHRHHHRPWDKPCQGQECRGRDDAAPCACACDTNDSGLMQ